MNTLNARLDVITCHLEALAASVGTLRLNLANLNRSLVRGGALDADRREGARRVTARRQTARRETTCPRTACRGDLDQEIVRLRQQLAAFRFESHQEHQELYLAGRDSVVQALIEGRAPSDRTSSVEAPGVGATGPSDGALLTRERSFTVPLCEGA